MVRMSEEELRAVIQRRQMQRFPISRRQGLQQLVLEGLDDDVYAAIASIEDETERKLINIWVEHADKWERESPELSRLASILGLSEDEVDRMYLAAQKL